MSILQFWIGVAAETIVARAVDGGFAELNRGKAGPLERMREGDGVAFYSPRTDASRSPPVQAFTAIGRVAGGAIFQGTAQGETSTFRRAVQYLPAKPAPIKPLIDELAFIRNKTHWGAPFRFGVVRVDARDFGRIAAAMGRDFEADFHA